MQFRFIPFSFFLTAVVKWSSFYPPPLTDGRLGCFHFSLLLPWSFSVCFSRMYGAESSGRRLYVIFSFLGSLSSPGPEGLLLYILIIFSIIHTFSSCHSVKSEPVSHCGLNCYFNDYCSDEMCLRAMCWLIYTPILLFTHFFPIRLLPILIVILCSLCGANTCLGVWLAYSHLNSIFWWIKLSDTSASLSLTGFQYLFMCLFFCGKLCITMKYTNLMCFIRRAQIKAYPCATQTPFKTENMTITLESSLMPLPRQSFPGFPRINHSDFFSRSVLPMLELHINGITCMYSFVKGFFLSDLT